MQYGETAAVYEKIPQKKSRRRGTPHIPEWLVNKPTLDISLQFYWGSYLKLTSERRIEGGQIPYSSIKQFARDHKVLDEDNFYYIINAMDSQYLEYQKQQRNRSRGK